MPHSRLGRTSPLTCLLARVLLGRTTFVNTLCNKEVLPHKESDDASSAHVEEGVKIKPITVGTHAAPPPRLPCPRAAETD